MMATGHRRPGSPGRDARRRAAPAAAPVRTKPFSSRSTSAESQWVFGAAPTMTNRAQAGMMRSLVSPTFRTVTASSFSLPCNAVTSAPYSIVMAGSAARRLER